MTKTELMENYTAEQLAEMVEDLRKDNERLQLEADIYAYCILPRATKEARELIDNRQYFAIKIVTDQEWENREENLQFEVEKYCKAFENAKKERDCQIAGYQKKIDDLERDLKTAGEKIQDLASENMKLQCERNDYKTKSEFLEVERMRVKKNEFTDFLPTEPIKVADTLINASKKRTNCMTGKEYDKYIFEKWQLRQIAEHLLIYCNHNGEAKE